MTGPLCIAEIGGNHRGELSTALRMVEIVATYCTEHFQLDNVRPPVAVKFQKRTPHLRPQDYHRPHPNPYFAYGDSYGAHREALEFTAEEHRRLFEHCILHGATYACSVWDVPAAEAIIRLGPKWLKIPSACNLDWSLLEFVAREHAGDIHLSLGMTTREETARIVEFLDRRQAADRTVLYACTSDYPVRFQDIRLDELVWLDAEYAGAVKGLGFSGHHQGIAADMAAVAMGAQYIERHFTLDRTWRGTDHAASLEPDGFRRLVRDVSAVHESLGSKPPGGMLACEEAQRAKLKVEPERQEAA